MSKKNETIRIGLLTAFIAFAAITAFAIVTSPSGGITTQAYAMDLSSGIPRDSSDAFGNTILSGCSVCK